jgi:acetolactate synthase-1/2/3 large subunit
MAPEATERSSARDDRGQSRGASNRTVAHVVAASLKRHGVEFIIGQSAPTRLFLLAPDYGMQTIGIRTEKAGAMIADGYARISHKVPVVTSIAGPGAALLVPGLGEAFKASIPIVALVQDVPRAETDKNPAQEFDHLDLFKPCAKFVRRVDRADRVEDYLDMAFAVAASGRPGPVVLMLPPDLFEDAAPAADKRMATLGRYPIDRTVADPARVAEAAALIADASCPIVVAGGGVHISESYDELARLQDLASLPVGTTVMGKGTVDENHSLSLGVVGYIMGRRGAARSFRALLKRSDLVFLIGNRTNQGGTDSWSMFSPGARFIHLDVDSLEVGRNYEVAVRLVGDAKLTLAALNESLKGRDLGKRRAGRATLEEEIAAGRQAFAAEVESVVSSDAKPIRPERVMRELAKIVTPETIVVGDASYATIWVVNYLKSMRAGMRFITPRGLAGIGWGFPLALGAKLAAPDRPVIYLGGDGAFAHAWAELETARRHRIQLTAIILNNQVLGYEKDAEDIHFGAHAPICHFEPVDHAAIARACGWFGVRVENPGDIAGAFSAASKADRPTLIDIISDPAAFPPIRSFDGKLPDPA